MRNLPRFFSLVYGWVRRREMVRDFRRRGLHVRRQRVARIFGAGR